MKNYKKACILYGEKLGFQNQDQRWAYEELLDQSWSKGENQFPKSISVHGSPVVYSWKYGEKDAKQGIRILAEPGQEKLSAHRQLTESLHLLNKLAAQRNWSLAKDLNQIISLVYPTKKEDIRGWRAAMWLGMDFTEADPGVKIYMNMETMNWREAWQKTVDVIGLYALPQMEETMKKIIDGTSEGKLAGVGIQSGKYGLEGIRIYVAFEKMQPQILYHIFQEFFPQAKQKMQMVLEDYQKTFQVNPQTLITFDFARKKSGYLTVRPFRVKMEVSCCTLSKEQQKQIPVFFRTQLKKFHIQDIKFQNDLKSSAESFEKIFFQYISFGISDNGEHMTIYFEPEIG